MVPKIILVSALATGILVAQGGQRSEALTAPTSVGGHASNAVALAHWRGGWGGWRGGGCWNCGRRWWGGGPWIGRPYFYGYGYPYYYRPYYYGFYAPYPRPYYSYNNAPYYPPRGLK